MKLNTPLVVGAKHEPPADDNTETEIIPYRYPFDGQLAIPGNSLRGTVASIAEAISQSSMRVLEKATYSVRKEAGEGLSAVGMLHEIVKSDGKKMWEVIPICPPLLELHRQGSSLPDEWQAVFSGVRLAECLPAYVDEYESRDEGDETILTYASDSFLDINRPVCFHGLRPEYWYAKIQNEALLKETLDSEISPKTAGLRVIANRMIGQDVAEVISVAEFQRRMDEYQKIYRKNPPALMRQYQQYVRGVLHVLGIDNGRKNKIPDSKHHERFLPWPASRKPTPLKVRPEAWNRFLRLAAERADTTKKEKAIEKKLPFQPQSYLQHKNPDALWKPCSGELVYFDIDGQGHVCELSYTSIWRRGIKCNIHDAFDRIDVNLPPWGHPTRTNLTPAESLFGVTPYAKLGDRPQSQSLASRVRFFDGFSVQVSELEREQIPLKILSNPKPPSPAMYFCEGAQIRKRDLLDISAVTPNGRKYYIPHKNAENPMRTPPWRSTSGEHRNQKMLCTPLRAR